MRNTTSIIPLFQSFTVIARAYQGRRASRCSALAPGYYIPRLWRWALAPGYHIPRLWRWALAPGFHIPRLWRWLLKLSVKLYFLLLMMLIVAFGPTAVVGSAVSLAPG